MKKYGCDAPTPPTGPDNTHLKSKGPIKWRLAMIMFAFVYPLVTMLVYVTIPQTGEWAIWHRTLIITPITVTMIVFVIHPLVFRLFGRYINAA
ncbi:hypothetical protein [Thalassospira lucentensis]|uniref:hypothetical protein n=1 Tax=Thalassospira lucentensis TaxID=168935 RepID=UPI003AA7F714